MKFISNCSAEGDCNIKLLLLQSHFNG